MVTVTDTVTITDTNKDTQVPSFCHVDIFFRTPPYCRLTNRGTVNTEAAIVGGIPEKKLLYMRIILTQ